MNRIAILAALALLAAGPAIAQQATTAQPAAGGASQSMMDSMNRMQQDMQAMRPTGNPDQDWAMMMRRHHQAAIDMSRAYRPSARDQETARMADKVIEEQTREIAQLDDWMRRHPR